MNYRQLSVGKLPTNGWVYGGWVWGSIADTYREASAAFSACLSQCQRDDDDDDDDDDDGEPVAVHSSPNQSKPYSHQR